MEDAHVSKASVMEVLLSIPDYDAVRMIRSVHLRHEPQSVMRERLVKPELGGFVGLIEKTNTRKVELDKPKKIKVDSDKSKKRKVEFGKPRKRKVEYHTAVVAAVTLKSSACEGRPIGSKNNPKGPQSGGKRKIESVEAYDQVEERVIKRSKV
jgi:hypothetical protein